MKKMILASVLCLSTSMVFAATACSGGTATDVTGATDGTKFVRTTFKPVCSTNSVVVYTDSGAKVYGGSASTKGASYFGASSDGGAVKREGACASNNCGGSEAASKADTGMTAAQSYGSSG